MLFLQARTCLYLPSHGKIQHRLSREFTGTQSMIENELTSRYVVKLCSLQLTGAQALQLTGARAWLNKASHLTLAIIAWHPMWGWDCPSPFQTGWRMQLWSNSWWQWIPSIDVRVRWKAFWTLESTASLKSDCLRDFMHTSQKITETLLFYLRWLTRHSSLWIYARFNRRAIRNCRHTSVESR